MGQVRIVTDSACDLRGDVADGLGILVVPLTIRFGDDSFVDGQDLSVEDFYDRMATTDQLPETAAPAPGQFGEAFDRAFDEGAAAVVCVNLSAELSATMASARTAAADRADREIAVFDSASITMGLGTMVTEAARAAAAGAETPEVVALLEDLRARTRVVGVLDTLDNLKKGGRIGGAQALIGSMLSIKPMVDISTGVVEEAGKHRTRRKSLQALTDRVAADGEVEHLALMHARAADIDDAVELLAAGHPGTDIHVDLIGPVIGTHAGPGTIGCCWVTTS